MPPKIKRHSLGSVLPDFEEMAQQLRATLKSLEDRAVSRTRDLEIAAQVSQEVAKTLDIDQLLPRLVNLTKNKFKLYHAHVYLLDENGTMLVMAAGAGKAGKTMKSGRHSIPLDAPRSLVARAARTREAVITNDVSQEEGFLPNPLLPDTRSEMAVPMIAGQAVIGVLDIQSDQVDRFAEDDVYVMSTLAGQVAVAVENAGAFAQVRKSQAEAEAALSTLARQNRFSAGVSAFATALLNKGIMGLADAIVPLAQAVEASRVYVFANFTNTEGLLAARQTHEWVNQGISPVPDQAVVYHTMLPHWKTDLLSGKPVIALRSQTPAPEIEIMKEQGILSLLLIPISTGEDISGFIGFDDCVQERSWGQAEIELLHTSGTSIAYALTSGQLLEQTQSALGRVQTLYRASLALLMAHDAGELLRAFVEPIFAKEPCQAELFYVINDDAGKPDWIELVTSIQPFPEGQMTGLKAGRYRVEDTPVARLLTADPNQITIVPDVAETHSLMSDRARQTFLAAGARSIAVIPLVSAKKQWIGVVTFSWPELHQLSPDDIELYKVLTPELATALENRRLVVQTREQEQLLRSVIDASPDWIYAKDLAHRYILVNKAYAEFLGHDTPGKLVGKDDSDLGIPIERVEQARAVEQSVLKDGSSVTNPHDSLKHADGTSYVFETTKVPLRDVAGGILGVLGLSRDVTERESARRRQETAYDLAQQLTTVLDPNKLLSETVNRLGETFKYYHAHIYLYDPERQALVVGEGLGEAGEVMKSAGHGIPLYAERSLVAEAARTLKPVVVQDVTENPQHLPNPLLPETLSEVALPLFVGEELLGVLDVQHNIARHFGADEVTTLQIVASQLSVALSNARLFEEAQRRAREMATMAEIGTQASMNLARNQLLQNVCDLDKERLNLYHVHVYLLDEEQRTLTLAAGAGAAGQTMVAGGHAIPLSYEHSLVARAARTGQPVVINDVAREPDFLPNPLLPETRSEMAVPMTLGMEIIGVLDVQANTANRFTEIDKNLQLTLANQVAVAISNARLFEETQKALADVEVLYMGSSCLVRASALDEILQALVASTALYHFDRATIEFFDKPWTDSETPSALSVMSTWEASGKESRMPVGSTYRLDEFPVTRHFKRHEAVVFEDVTTDPRVDEISRELFRERIEMRGLAVFPIVTGDAWLGVIMGETSWPMRVKEEATRQLQVLTEQASAVIYNIRLLEEAQATAKQLRELDKLKSEFLASMSHELRTPLNSIIGYSELMIDGIGEELDEMSLEDLKSIHSSGMYLLALINDVLDLAKIEAGRLELTRSEVDLNYMVPEIIEAARVLMQEKPNLELVIDIPEGAPMIYADSLRLRQIIWNLLSNAIKFTTEGHIRLFCQQKDGWIQMGVEDTGMGIPLEHHEIIFDQFRQVDGSATRKVGGTGLGLAITRELVRLHGGDLWVESEVGKGSTFIFNLPSSPAQAKEVSGGVGQQSADQAKGTTPETDPTLAVQPTEVVGD